MSDLDCYLDLHKILLTHLNIQDFFFFLLSKDPCIIPSQINKKKLKKSILSMLLKL